MLKAAKVRGVWIGKDALPDIKASAVTIGMFDGVHAAHRHLLERTLQRSGMLQVPSIALTFDPDPQLFFGRGEMPHALMPLKERTRLIRQAGIDGVWVLPFDASLARLSAAEFIKAILVDRLHVASCVVGHDFVFGRDRKGTAALLQRAGKRLGFGVDEIAAQSIGGTLVSSSEIRRAIRTGALQKARKLLGRNYALYGRVVQGSRRGRTLGVPTANLKLTAQVLPPTGVYAVLLHTSKGKWNGVMNLGFRPTFDAGFACEVHVLDAPQSLDLYRLKARAELVRFLRKEQTFPDAETLREQIRKDITAAREVLV